MVHLGDICQICGLDIEPVDVVTGGSPCQDLSVAGGRAGLAGERSGLFREQIRVVRELRIATLGTRPRFMVWENVPGALSSNRGRDFMEVLHECIKTIEPEAPAVHVPAKGWPSSGCLYDELGHWSVAWRVHNARFWGVPQNRRRIALVCDFGGLAAPQVLFEHEGVRGDSTARTGAESAATSGATGCLAIYDSRGNGDGVTAGTICDDHNNRVTDYTSLVVNSYGVNADCRRSGLSAIPEAAHTLGTTQREAVAISIANGQRNSSATLECARALNCMHTPETVIVCDRAASNQGVHAKFAPFIGYSDTSPTILAAGPHAVSVPPRYRVRRLTPLECERLQGFPDDWTRPCETFVDSRGRTREITDTARYRALGNSIALPFWRWLLQRIHGIVKTYEPRPLLGSLFDGIGGFPLCWPGRTAWASEIDDFCVAVTKQHFSEDT